MRRRIVVRERPFYSDKARTDGERTEEGEGAAISGEFGGKKGGERLFDTEDKLRVALPRTKQLALKCFNAIRPASYKNTFRCFHAKSFLWTYVMGGVKNTPFTE